MISKAWACLRTSTAFHRSDATTNDRARRMAGSRCIVASPARSISRPVEMSPAKRPTRKLQCASPFLPNNRVFCDVYWMALLGRRPAPSVSVRVHKIQVNTRRCPLRSANDGFRSTLRHIRFVPELQCRPVGKQPFSEGAVASSLSRRKALSACQSYRAARALIARARTCRSNLLAGQCDGRILYGTAMDVGPAGRGI
jgi:hypothetical protein